MSQSITLTVDLPESLHRSLCDFLEEDSQWDFNQVFSVALLQFLQQNSAINRNPSSIIQRSVTFNH